jgi:hypothetical protein
MRRITIEEHLRQLEARRAELGFRDDEPSALNSGRRRHPSKRALLEEIEAAKRPRAANVAEAPLAVRTESYFARRAARDDTAKTIEVLDRAGRGNRPIKGDELPRSRKKS